MNALVYCAHIGHYILLQRSWLVSVRPAAVALLTFIIPYYLYRVIIKKYILFYQPPLTLRVGSITYRFAIFIDL